MSRRSPANPGGVDVHTDDLGRTHEQAPLRRHTGSEATHRMLTLVTAAGLGVDAYVHWHLAPGFDTLTGARCQWTYASTPSPAAVTRVSIRWVASEPV